ncbi:MAG: VTT domain-containing protein [Myxococcaceae bacterium]|nr:VTT domain-containing protein [Myxococcaceae bacterium]
MRRALRWVLLALAVAAAVALRHHFGDRLSLENARRVLEAVREAWWAPPAYLGLYAAGTTLLLPAVSFAILAGAVFGFGPGLLLSQVGLSLTANAHFALGRWLGQGRVQPWLERRGFGRLTAELSAHGVTSVIAIRQLPLPFVAVNVACGAAPVRWRDFALGSALGGLAPSLVYTWSAAALASGDEGAWTAALIRAAIGGGTMLLVSYGLRRYLARQAAVTPR